MSYEKITGWFSKNKKRIKTCLKISGITLAAMMLLQSLMGQIVFAAFIREEDTQKLEYGYIIPMRAGEWELAYAIMVAEENAIRSNCRAMKSTWKLSIMLNPIRTYTNLRRAFTDYSNSTWRNYQRTKGYVKYERDKLRNIEKNPTRYAREDTMSAEQAAMIVTAGN